MGKKPSFWILNVIRLLSMAGTVLVAYGEGRRFEEVVRLLTTDGFGREGNICGFIAYVYGLLPLTSIPTPCPQGLKNWPYHRFTPLVCLISTSSADPAPCT
jgi:hypothetical protein